MPVASPSRKLAEAFKPLNFWERLALAALFTLIVIFGGLVELRSAFLQRHMTDLGVYLRAGWAVRTGTDLYDVMDDNGWHYQYPPLFAILMVPLADPPAGVSRNAMMPFAAAAAIWYVLGIAFLALGLHCLASALEGTWPDPRLRRPTRGCRRWWALRLWPALVCIAPIGHTLMRGQVNLLLLFLLCAMCAALVKGQSARAGLWLAGAICLKVIPAFLLLIPLWRRDARCLTACACGLFVGLLVVPGAVFGVPRTVAYYQEYAEKLLWPGVGRGNDQSRARELIEVTATDSQSFLAIFHNTQYVDRWTRPSHPSEAARWINRGLGVIITLVTLGAFGWRRSRGAPEILLFCGGLILIMLFLSPVCHLHYFCLSAPLIMGLIGWKWQTTGDSRLGTGLTILFAVNVVANFLPNFQGLELSRDLGLAMYAAVLLWGVGCVVSYRSFKRIQPAPLDQFANVAA